MIRAWHIPGYLGNARLCSQLANVAGAIDCRRPLSVCVRRLGGVGAVYQSIVCTEIASARPFFLIPPSRRDKPGDDLDAYEPNLYRIDTKRCPYPIINASLNIERSQYANKRGRNADFFIFTPEYTGSDATGYVGTQQIEKEETALDLGTAMAISAAAVSSNMGSVTVKPLAFTLALLNMRLGYWLRNPKYIKLAFPR